MKLWCVLIVSLIVTFSTSFVYSNDELNSPVSNEQNPLDFQSLVDMNQDQSIVKRSQRNANILYRHCRLSGGTKHFCIKYAIRMLYATGN